jgi:hypothetical protein
MQTLTTFQGQGGVFLCGRADASTRRRSLPNGALIGSHETAPEKRTGEQALYRAF